MPQEAKSTTLVSVIFAVASTKFDLHPSNGSNFIRLRKVYRKHPRLSIIIFQIKVIDMKTEGDKIAILILQDTFDISALFHPPRRQLDDS